MISSVDSYNKVATGITPLEKPRLTSQVTRYGRFTRDEACFANDTFRKKYQERTLRMVLTILILWSFQSGMELRARTRDLNIGGHEAYGPQVEGR
ncbi:hypothetical protein NPIL_368721 [Nephila pilipes]|uniref:Uncharacterized protein n=1 Tax=Nephila pilipes TaxID=299642 RepID=A0A8X6T577_NEPPI|nr:hypothetical protein NPIL_368721 [Nephila pilipes]